MQYADEKLEVTQGRLGATVRLQRVLSTCKLQALKGLQEQFPEFRFNFRIKRGPQTKTMHARFALLTWSDRRVLFWPDRGFDLEDKNGLAHGGPVQIYINPPSSLLTALTQE